MAMAAVNMVSAGGFSTMAMAAVNMVSAGGFSGVRFHSIRCPQGVASVLCEKTTIFGSRRSKLDHLTVVGVLTGDNWCD